MFTGIVQSTAPVVGLKTGDRSLRLTLDLGEGAKDLKTGASVSVGGVCLTAANIDGQHVSFDVIGETIDKTTLGHLSVGDRINIERSARLGDEIGGHRVSGHVTGTAAITRLETPNDNTVLTLSCDSAGMECILPKGFIALDGCSLTIVDVGPDWFTVHLIPETLRLTTFGEKIVGSTVNLELDPETQAIVETVKRYLTTHSKI